MRQASLTIKESNQDFLKFIHKYPRISKLTIILPDLKSLDLSFFNNIEELYIYCSLENLNITGCRKLKTLYCSRNQLKLLNLSANFYLETLDCSYNLLRDIDIQYTLNLKYLNYSGNNGLNTLSLKSHNKLIWLINSDCEISELNLDNNKNLKYIDSGYNHLINLDLTNCKDLIHINLTNNNLIQLYVYPDISLGV